MSNPITLFNTKLTAIECKCRFDSERELIDFLLENTHNLSDFRMEGYNINHSFAVATLHGCWTAKLDEDDKSVLLQLEFNMQDEDGNLLNMSPNDFLDTYSHQFVKEVKSKLRSM